MGEDLVFLLVIWKKMRIYVGQLSNHDGKQIIFVKSLISISKGNIVISQGGRIPVNKE